MIFISYLVELESYAYLWILNFSENNGSYFYILTVLWCESTYCYSQF